MQVRCLQRSILRTHSRRKVCSKLKSSLGHDQDRRVLESLTWTRFSLSNSKLVNGGEPSQVKLYLIEWRGWCPWCFSVLRKGSKHTHRTAVHWDYRGLDGTGSNQALVLLPCKAGSRGVGTSHCTRFAI